MHPQNNKPLDKGRVACIAEKYQQGNETKNRYATLGRATKWPSSNQGGSDSIEIELDTMPINQQGPLKLYIFWESENQQSQGYAPPQYQSQPAPQYDQQQYAPQNPAPQQYGQQRQ
ncbi:hypothetical protein PNIG_a1633 [Pseudoalteromonas nigrifaciens]|uniref:Uncharacterized protein n=1 Tax=Pseudoalteromonas nigrifaciens TaxID=28109 RepID=A0AAC9UI45_9GAMM|nr:hypothetical protein [Pseudoalteromonas nigrifaciens]ASM53769.1 hypothetical protein PNIG_a1633 [Pseudoalteromonas nigrifaciens]GEN40761.1 hypothetical protein PNI02_02270 [Pseudoalteromonas nigrifaciens]SUC52388.1 Uncharacterised protein [Pseudoalteromonas nigrifaciens]